jgi:CBS domain-containing protein
LPVVDDQRRVIGVISERDVLRLLYDFEDAGGRVEDFMTAQVRCFSKDTPIQDICLCFKEHAFRRVPILENGQLVGIISRKDLIRFIREKYREQSP